MRLGVLCGQRLLKERGRTGQPHTSRFTRSCRGPDRWARRASVLQPFLLAN